VQFIVNRDQLRNLNEKKNETVVGYLRNPIISLAVSASAQKGIEKHIALTDMVICALRCWPIIHVARW